ncbi:MAG TPA: aminotransferase class I/II-fold pyridoxal phosphate-dependent enzyme [Candidatus Krumholzibacteria bacterium]|nr:aminotransferase class I/II-fold pyridoxal phosphate-dependent enzyme [Candidatus Krumholzibacteria bacterium]
MTREPFEIPCARRVAALPPYVFATTARWKEEALAAGRDVIDLGVGNPDGRPAPEVIQALKDAVDDPRHNLHGYSTFRGHPALRRAIAAFYAARFGVPLDPESETLPLIGSKEGLANLMRGYLDTGDTILIPTPCYPAYFGAARLCEATIVEVPLRPERGFVLDFADIPADAADRARMLIVNYPNNPTGGVAGLAFFAEAVRWCREHQVLLVSDAAYTELGFDPASPPPSVLQVPGAKAVAIEFQSLSKSHNMAGWRTGFAVGGPEVIATLGRVKSNVDFSLFGAVQVAAAAALTGDQQVCADNRTLYRHRRDRLVAGLAGLGWTVPVPPATMYVWAPIPAGWNGDDLAFVREVFDRTAVLLSPGSAFGRHGAGWCRFSLVADDAGLDEVLQRLAASGLDWT